MGHTIKPLRPVITPILTREDVSALEGLSLDNVILCLYDKNKKIAQESGPIIFTANGLSGPAALNISRSVDLTGSAAFRLEIDSQPADSPETLMEILQSLLMGNNKLLRNSLEGLMPLRYAESLIASSGLDADRVANSLNRSEREKLARSIKSQILSVRSLEGYNRAMVTAGGVDLKEVDPSTMRSKLIDNLFLAGEILDLAGPTGGYNLQLAWSTGYAAGMAVAEGNAPIKRTK